jgi:hypothetical protein
MPWGAPVAYDPFAEDAPAKRSTWDGIKSVFTGEGRTEFPEAPEFAAAQADAAPDEVKQAASLGLAGGGGFTPAQTDEQQIATADYLDQTAATGNSNITPDEQAQFDIMAKAIPGLERKTDKHGNLMLKAPGMGDFAYLNKPGVSTRDMTEFGLQTAATLPLASVAAPVRGAGVMRNMLRGAGGLMAASVEQDKLAEAAGSEQGIDEGRALLSGGIGAALPAAGAVARTGAGFVSGVGNNIRTTVSGALNPRETARREVQHAFNQDAAAGALRPERAAQAADVPIAARYGQDLRAVDFGGEAVQGEARKAANLSPSARDSFMRIIGERFEGQTGRAEDLLAGRMNLGNSAQLMRTQLKEQARQARAPLYMQAFGAGKDGFDTPVLRKLQESPTFQRAMGSAERRVTDQASTPGWKTTGVRGKNGHTLEFWDQVKQTLDDYAGQAYRKGANGQGAQLTTMAKALREELDAQGQVGKLYHQARGTAMRFFRADDALEAGENFAKQADFNFDHARQAMAQLNPAEKNLFTEGFADHFLRKIRKSTDRTNLLNKIAQSPMERQRLEIALGTQRYEQLDSFLRLEGIMDRLRTAMGNSTTARQAADMMKGYGVQLGGYGLSYHGYNSNDPGMMIFGAVLAGGRAAQLRINERVAQEIAEWLVSKDPDVFLKGLQAVGKQPISQAIRAFDNLLADAGIATPIAAQTSVNQGER